MDRSLLHAIADLVAGGEPPEHVVITGACQLWELFALQDCRFERAPFVADEVLTWRLNLAGDVSVGTVVWRRPTRLPGPQLELLVASDDTCFGRFVLVLSSHLAVPHDRRVLAVQLADQVARAFSLRATLAES